MSEAAAVSARGTNVGVPRALPGQAPSQNPPSWRGLGRESRDGVGKGLWMLRSASAQSGGGLRDGIPAEGRAGGAAGLAGAQGWAHLCWDGPKSPWFGDVLGWAQHGMASSQLWPPHTAPGSHRLCHSRDGSHPRLPLSHPRPGWTIPVWNIFGSCSRRSKTVQSQNQTAPGRAGKLKLAGVPQAEATWGFVSFRS